MAYTIFSKEEEGVMFCRAVQAHWPGARAYASSDPVYGEWTYAIKFANDTVFSGTDMMTVVRQAETYAAGIKALTGEYP